MPRPHLSKTQMFLLRGSLRCMVVFGGLWFLFPLLTWSNGDSLSWLGDAGDARAATWLHTAPGADLYWQGQVEVGISHPPAGLRLVSWIHDAIVAVAVISIGFLLLRLMYATQEGQPFFASSAPRLRVISIVIGVAAVAQPIAWSVANSAVLEAAIPHLRVEPHLHFATMATWLVVALVVRVVAEAFRIGTRMRDEVEGLV